MKRSNRLVLLIGIFLAVLAFSYAAVYLGAPSGVIQPVALASARVDVDAVRTPDGWTVTQRVTFTKDTEAAIRAKGMPAQPPASGANTSEFDVTSVAVAENAAAGWALTGTLDEHPVFERTATVPDPDTRAASGWWSTDAAIPLPSFYVAGVRVVASDGSSARIIAPPRVIVATAPAAKPVDQLNGTVRWDVKLEDRGQEVVVRIAPGWAREAAFAPLFAWLAGDPIGSVVSKIGAGILGTFVAAVVAFLAWKGGLWGKIQSWRGRWPKTPDHTTGRDWSESMTRDQRLVMAVHLLDGLWSSAAAHPTDEKVARFGAELALACTASPDESLSAIAARVYRDHEDVKP